MPSPALELSDDYQATLAVVEQVAHGWPYGTGADSCWLLPMMRALGAGRQVSVVPNGDQPVIKGRSSTGENALGVAMARSPTRWTRSGPRVKRWREPGSARHSLAGTGRHSRCCLLRAGRRSGRVASLSRCNFAGPRLPVAVTLCGDHLLWG